MPRFAIKQENYELPPTAEQRKLMLFCGVTIPPTRITAHLAICALKQTQEGKAKIKAWQLLRREERSHAHSGSVGDVLRTSGDVGGANR